MIHLKNQILSSGNKIPKDYVVAYDLQGNVIDSSANNQNGIAVGTNPLPTYSAGRKGTDLCANFNGTTCFRTPNVVQWNTNQLSFSYWIKTSQTSLGMILESSANTNNATSSFFSMINEAANKVRVYSYQSSVGYNIRPSILNINNNTWIHVVGTIDRTKNGTEEIKVFINGVDNTGSGTLGDTNNNFTNDIIYFGQRGGSSFGFVGSLQQIRIYKRILTQAEITQLYNE